MFERMIIRSIFFRCQTNDYSSSNGLFMINRSLMSNDSSSDRSSVRPGFSHERVIVRRNHPNGYRA